MNTIQQFYPNYYQNYQSKPLKYNEQNIQFRGLGDEIVKGITRDTVADKFAEQIIDKISGPLGGIKRDKLVDVLKSLVGKVQSLVKEVNILTIKLKGAEKEINGFSVKKEKAVNDAVQALTEQHNLTIEGKNAEISGLKERVTLLQKYEAMAKVKSIDEIGIVTPDRVVEAMNEMVKQEVPARKSMAEFLFSGDASKLTEAKAQLERNVVISKAEQDGIFNIPEVADIEINLRENEGLRHSGDADATLSLIRYSLEGSPKGSYLANQAIREQVKDNAWAILSPMAGENPASLKKLQEGLEYALDKAKEYHLYFRAAKERVASMTGFDKKYAQIEYKPFEFAPEKSRVILYENGNNGKKVEFNYYQFCRMRDAVG